MKLSELRPALLAWFSDQITIDSLYLEIPEKVGETSAFLSPFEDFRIERLDGGNVMASLSVIFMAVSRFPDTPYKDLGLEVPEGNYGTVSYRLALGWQDIHPDLTRLDIQEVTVPLRAREVGDRSGEWLLENEWSFVVWFPLEPEEGDGDLVEANAIRVALYRASLGDLDVNTKDLDISVEH